MYEKLVELINNDFSCGNRIIGSEESYRSAVLVPFVNINGTESILFEKRAADIRQGGEICFPGGMIDEDDETSLHAVIRETIEETGIRPELLEVHDSAGYLITRIGSLIEVFIGRMNIESIDELPYNKSEVERLFTVPVSFFLDNPPEKYNYRLTLEPWYEDDAGNRVDLFPARDLGLPERYWNSWSHQKNKFIVYRCADEVIWGITARIMYTVSKLMRRTVS